MKCPNCGAEGTEGKFCQHCGTRLPEAPDPTTMAGALNRIVQGTIGKQLEYNRIHADEISERKARKERESFRQALYILIIAAVLLAGIIGLCLFMAAREKGLA